VIWRGRSTKAADVSEIPAVWLAHAVRELRATTSATGFRQGFEPVDW
jgi:hypothetical protein